MRYFITNNFFRMNERSNRCRNQKKEKLFGYSESQVKPPIKTLFERARAAGIDPLPNNVFGILKSGKED